MGRRSRSLVFVLVAVAAASCSGSDGDTTGNATTTAAPSTSSSTQPATTIPVSTTTTTRAVNPPADTALAQSALLKLPDLPPGWTAAPHAVIDGTALNASIGACLKVAPELVSTDLQPHADAEDFTGPSGEKVWSGVAIFPDVSLAKEWIDLYETQGARDCLASSIGSSVGAPLQASPLSLPAIGDGQVGISFGPIDITYARRGRAIVYITAQGPQSLDRAGLLTKMTDRLQTSE